MRTRLAFLAAALLLPLAVACSDRAAATVQPQLSGISPVQPAPTLSASGTATIEVVPDLAEVRMTLSTEDPKPKKAVTELRKRQAELAAALAAAGLKPTDIRVSFLSLTPVYDPNPKIVRIRGYQASITVVASTKNFDLIGDIIEGSAGAGVTQVSTAFTISDLPALKKRVREQALESAKANAEQMARVLGIQLAKVTSVGEQPQGYYWQFEHQMPNAMMHSGSVDGFMLPEQQPLSLTVHVAYQIG